MTHKRLNGTDVRTPLSGEAGNVRQIILLVILIIVAGFAYLYFFTGLIKPHEETPSPPPPVAAKQPIPPRPAQPATAQPAPATVAQPATPAKAAPAPVAQPAAPAKTAAEPAKPAATPVKPAAVPAKEQKPAPAKAESVPVKPVAAKPVPVPVKEQKAAPAKPAPPAVKAAVPAKPVAKVADAKQKPSVKKEAAKQVVAKKTPGNYTLSIGTYVVEKSMAADKVKLKKAGLSPVVKKGEVKQEPMTRLYLATFANYDEAAAELKKLRQSSGDGFFVPEGDSYAVYAGSYFLESRAAIEQDRLGGRGIKTVMKKVNVPVPTLRLTAGRFSTREDAAEAVVRLKKLGITATVTHLN